MDLFNINKSLSADRKLIDLKSIDLKKIVDESKDIFISTQTYKFQDYLTDVFVP